MIRHIRLTNQVNEDADDFAFFDTVTNRFVEIAGQQVFTDRADLEDAFTAAGTEEGVRARLVELLPGVPRSLRDFVDNFHLYDKRASGPVVHMPDGTLGRLVTLPEGYTPPEPGARTRAVSVEWADPDPEVQAHHAERERVHGAFPLADVEPHPKAGDPLLDKLGADLAALGIRIRWDWGMRETPDGMTFFGGLTLYARGLAPVEVTHDGAETIEEFAAGLRASARKVVKGLPDV